MRSDGDVTVSVQVDRLPQPAGPDRLPVTGIGLTLLVALLLLAVGGLLLALSRHTPKGT